MKHLLIILVLGLLAIGLGLPATHVSAYSASLYFSPSSGARTVGGVFSVQVRVATGGTASNSIQADFKFPTDKLEVTSIGTGGSVCTLFAVQPNYSNGSGTADTQCGTPNPGFNGDYLVETVSFRAKNTGSATVSMSASSQVLANDGSGTNILTSLGSTTFTIVQPPTAAPTVTSSTQPDQTLWYKGRSVALSWSGGYSGYSYDFNQTADFSPDQTSEGPATSKTYDNVQDGIWYFHLRGLGSGGWSGVTHYRVQIDNVAPLDFTPVIDPKGEISVRPTVSFATTDATSGIDHYEIRIDSGDFFKVESPYKPDRISSGEHVFTVRAFDKAGNFTDGVAKVKIKEIPAPTITSPTSGYMRFLEKLVVRGTGPADGMIAVFLNDKVIAQDITVGKDGKWDYTHNDTLFPGKYRLYAVVTADGIDSRPSNVVDLIVDASVISIGPFNIPSWLIILVLLVLLGAMTATAIYLWERLAVGAAFVQDRVREKIRGLREEVGEDMTRLEHKVENDIEGTLQDADSNKMRTMEHTLEKSVEVEIEETKEHLKRDIDQTENDLKKK